MSHRTESATPLDAVLVASPQVFLRRNIETKERTREFDAGDGEATTYAVYVADEVILTDPTITAEYAEAHFEELWEAAEALALTPREYAERLSAENGDAIADLSEAVSDNATSLSDISDALAELSQVVSDNATGKEA